MSMRIETASAEFVSVKGTTEANLAANVPSYGFADVSLGCIVFEYADTMFVVAGTGESLRGFADSVSLAAAKAGFSYDAEVAARETIRQGAMRDWKAAVAEGETELGFDEWLQRWNKGED